MALLPHQVSAIHRITHEMNGRALVALAAGLGKTRVAVEVAAHYNLRTLVVCPASKSDDWVSEFKRWRNIDAAVVKCKKDPVQAHVVVMSYALARMLFPLANTHFACVICDESHNLKERTAQQTQKILALLIKARVALLLSATPQLSRPYELWTQLSALDMRTWGSWWEFTKRYCEGIEGLFGWEYRGASNLDELQERMAPYVILGEKSLLKLPPKTRHFVKFDLEEQDVGRLGKIRAELIQLQKVIKTPWDKQRADAAMMHLWRETGKAKLGRVCAWLKETLGDGKMCVFGHHEHVLDGIENFCVDQGLAYIRIDGKVASKKRQALVEQAAQADGPIRVAILSLNSCGVGITLCPGLFRLCFAELSWNPAMFDQAEDRIHRIGTTMPCSIHYLLANASFDNDILGILARKRALSVLDIPDFTLDSSVEFYEEEEDL